MTTLVDAPTRVDGVQLIGEMVGSGYRTPPALVRRADGQVLQLTPLLYLVLHAADGRRSCAEIADVVGRALDRGVAENDVRTWVDNQLRPLGLLKQVDGSEPELKRSNPLLGLKLRFAITNPRTTHRLTDPFRVLFRPVLTAAVLVGFVAVVELGVPRARPRRLGVRRVRAAAVRCCSSSRSPCSPAGSTSSVTLRPRDTAVPSPA